MKYTTELLQTPCLVLIVDDDGMLADAYQRIIQRAGGHAISVSNGYEATRLLENTRVDVVLLDLRMPIMDGIQLLQWMQDQMLSDIVTVVLSNYDNPRDIKRAYELGADRYVLKAWASPNDLIKMLNETFAQQSQKSHEQPT